MYASEFDQRIDDPDSDQPCSASDPDDHVSRIHGLYDSKHSLIDIRHRDAIGKKSTCGFGEHSNTCAINRVDTYYDANVVDIPKFNNRAIPDRISTLCMTCYAISV